MSMILASAGVVNTVPAGGGGDPLVDNVGDTYWTMGSPASDTSTLYFEAAFEKQTDGVFQNLYECSGRSQVALNTDNTVYVRVENTAGGTVIYSESTTETITTSDGVVRLIVNCDMSVPSVSVTIDGAAATIAAAGTTGTIEHTRTTTGFLASAAGGGIADVHLQDLRFSIDDQSTYLIDVDAASGASTLNTGANDGTASLTVNGTGFSDV